MSVIDATLRVAPNGATWIEAHWIEHASLDDPLPTYRIVEIADGAGCIPPLIVNIEPDRDDLPRYTITAQGRALLEKKA
jgi:hypothetical protein